MRYLVSLLMCSLTSLSSFSVFAQDRDEKQNKSVAPKVKPSSDQNGDTVYGLKEVDTKPIILLRPEQETTEEAKHKLVGGPLWLRVILSVSGEVKNIEMLQGLPAGLTERAIKAAQQIKFKPAIKDGLPVSVRIKIQYNFRYFGMKDGVIFGNSSKKIFYHSYCDNYFNIKSNNLVFFLSEDEAKSTGFSKAWTECP